MKRVSFQGTSLSASQRRHLQLQASMRSASSSSLSSVAADFEKLRVDLDARMFVGPPKPLHCYQMSDQADSDSYWRMAEEYSRYARCETKESGTPSVAEWMGN